jgi:hypothetical protein
MEQGEIQGGVVLMTSMEWYYQPELEAGVGRVEKKN